MSRSTQGYAAEAGELLRRYETIQFADRHGPAMHLVPVAPCNVLELGAGTGSDAAYLAALGHRVLAVEPVAELRLPAMALHPSPGIEWLDDSLPSLSATRARGQRYDLVMLTAVWMHLDDAEREIAMPIVASLVAEGGRLFLSLRHGPVPAGRRMFEVPADETVALALRHGLVAILNVEAEAAQEENRRAGVTWTHLVFART